MAGKVYLVGAGPGDPDLITLKAVKLIQAADVIAYDRLVNEQILAYAKAGAELLRIGKAPGQHSYLQEEINQLLIHKALAGQMVVRLKGGDPFVFGRGGEEALALGSMDIPFEVVPGVTSAVAVPAYAGIPVTHRGISSSFTVVTGNEDLGKPQSQVHWEKIASLGGTLVILMGMKNLPNIVDKLLQHLPSSTPVAIIRQGTTDKQEMVAGTLADILVKAKEAAIKHPAVIVVGNVVELREQIGWFLKP